MHAHKIAHPCMAILQDMKAVKRMGRQILRGLQYLHSKDPPITHGDLRCDKIYVNGHSGEIKIGDLGLATLMPYRWEGSGPAPQQQLPMDASCDIFAFGLCILELLTLKQLDPQHCDDWPHLVANVQVIATEEKEEVWGALIIIHQCAVSGLFHLDTLT